MDRKTNKEVLIVIISVLIVVLTAWLSIYPSIQTLRNTNYELSLRQKDLDNAESHLESLKSLESKFDSQKRKLGALEEAMPNREDVESLLAMMESAAAKNGLIITGLTPLSSEDEDEFGETGEATIMTSSGLGVQEAIYEMGLIGSYGTLEKFLSQIENSRRAINVTGLTISSSITVATPDSLNITLEFKTYYLKEV